MNLKFYHLDVRGTGFLNQSGPPPPLRTRLQWKQLAVTRKEIVMPQQPTPEERRFERIEAAHETLATAVAAIASDTHALFKLKTDQDKKLNALTSFMSELALSQTAAEVQIAKMAEAQTRTEEHIGKIADAQVKLTESQAKSDLAQAETQGKLDALIDMWDRSIRERGGKNGGPAPEPPPSA